MSRVVRNPAFCICEKENADQLLLGNREADQRLCFRYSDYSTIPLLSKYEISSFYPSSVVVQPGLSGNGSWFSHNEAHILAKFCCNANGVLFISTVSLTEFLHILL